MGFSSDFTPICCSDAAKTETQYDALGRATIITATDGTPAEHRYRLAVDNGPTLQVENVVDANRHRRQTRTDAFGRLVKVVTWRSSGTRPLTPSPAADLQGKRTSTTRLTHCPRS